MKVAGPNTASEASPRHGPLSEGSTDDDAALAALWGETTPTAIELAILSARLADEAGKTGILDIAYATVDTPVGLLLLATTERGLVRVAFEREGHAHVLEALAHTISPRILEDPARLSAVVAQIREYFARERRHFDLPLDFTLSRGFRLAVQQHLPDITYGHTRSYKELAEAIGNPKAIRAVGTACATNPLPVVVPCHRVVRADGALGGYLGGLAAKRTLLDLERAA